MKKMRVPEAMEYSVRLSETSLAFYDAALLCKFDTRIVNFVCEQDVI